MLVKITLIDDQFSLNIDFKITGEGFKHMIKNHPDTFIKEIERYEELLRSGENKYTEPEYTPFFPPAV